MRHNKKTVKLGRTAAHRRALFRNLLSSLFLHGSIITTDAKAKEVKRRADRLIGLAKKGTLAARRRAAGALFGKEPLRALFERWVPMYEDRVSGFTRLVRVGAREGDRAPLTVVELIGAVVQPAEGSEEAQKQGT